MAKSIRAHLELVSERDVQKIERLDARELSSKPDKFVEANLLNYYVLINTWLLIIQQWSRYGWVFIRQYLLDNGLINCIKRFDESATELINGVDVSFSLARNIYKDVCEAPEFFGIPHDSELTVHNEPLSAMLLVCRYPKRFSPLEADILRKASLDGFVATQRDLKALQRQEPSYKVVQYVKEAVSELLPWDKLVERLGEVDLTDIIFTPGVSYSTKADLVSKLRAVVSERVEYFPQPFGVPMVAHGFPVDPSICEYWGKHMDIEVHAVRLSPVPKNYKTARVIAPEDVVRQALARRYFVVSDAMLPEMIKLHDQSQNQILAQKGSVDGSLATIDLHAASDRITISTLRSLLPSKFMDVVQRILPTHYELGGKRYRLESAATMGNSMTFWLESVVFAAISTAAVRYYNLFSGESDETISVYGDDIIVPSKAAPLVAEWLQLFGFIVNEDKSYWDMNLRYRESCGVEYLDGINVSSRYFPRFPLIGKLGEKLNDRSVRDSFTGQTTTSLTSLIDLQHKLFGICVPASLLVSEVVREAEPRMTVSSPDENYLDLWSYETKPMVVPAPAGVVDTTKTVVRKTKGGLAYKSFVCKNTAVEGMDREAHLTPVTVYPKSEASDTDRMLVNLYNYQHFLKYGPSYGDALDRLLGVSLPPLSIEEASSQGEVKWVYVK